jgi:Pvc16 N-terminal domain/IPT/TIG domain
MSNYLAVATVTAALQHMLDPVIGTDVPGATATTVRPDAPGHGVPDVGVNIFLYQIAPNAVLRNMDLPTRSGNGDAVQRPAAALDLHYLMSFYGDDRKLEPQLVLGSVVRYLHSRPLLTRKMIQETVTAFSFPKPSNLADAVEPVRLSPLSLSLEELSKLWSIFFQTPYVLSTAYRASLVFIEEELTPVTPLPVRDRQLFVVPFQQPFIENLDPKILTTGATLTIQGQNLRGDVTEIKFGDAVVLPLPADVSNREITVALPATLQPGVRTAQVIHDFDFKSGIVGNEPHRGFESNVAPFILQPKIMTDPIPPTAAGGTLTLHLAPEIGREQSVALLLNSDTNNYVIPLPTRPLTDPDTADSFSFKIPATVSPATYFVRTRVDSAESALKVDTNTLEYIGPKVTIT